MKGVNLTETNLTLVLISENGTIEGRYRVKDDGGNILGEKIETREFADWTNQIRAAANNLMRLLSIELNQAEVNENSSTWVDK